LPGGCLSSRCGPRLPIGVLLLLDLGQPRGLLFLPDLGLTRDLLWRLIPMPWIRGGRAVRPRPPCRQRHDENQQKGKRAQAAPRQPARMACLLGKVLLELEREFRAAAKPAFRPLLERAKDDLCQLGIDAVAVGTQGRNLPTTSERRRRVPGDLLLHRKWRRPLERHAPREQFVQHDPHRVDVGQMVDLVGREDLLGAHVFQRSDASVAGPGESLLTERPRDAEVDHADPTPVVQHEIARLEIPMHDAVFVRVIHRAQRVAAPADGLLLRVGFVLAKKIGKAATGKVLLDDAVLAFVQQNVEDSGQVRVPKTLQDLCLPEEALDQLLVEPMLLLQLLDDHPRAL
jgi:hypothetical protein